MRIALLADIHGNLLALDAVLADIQAHGGVDSYWVLGDLCAIGYEPAGVLARLSALQNTLIIQGNVDRYVTTGDRPPPTIDDVQTNPKLMSTLVEVAGSFGWTQGYLAAHGWFNWLTALPLEYRLLLPDGTRVLLVHAAPGMNDGFGLTPSLTDEQLRAEIAGCEADLICVGHFHVAMDRRLDGKRIINPGCVGNQFPPDLRAAYAILTADARGYTISFYRVAYDTRAAIEACIRSKNPGAGYIIRFLEGKVEASWLAGWDGISHAPPLANGR